MADIFTSPTPELIEDYIATAWRDGIVLNEEDFLIDTFPNGEERFLLFGEVPENWLARYLTS